MAALASIPEAVSSRSASSPARLHRPRVASFERLRPRNRVLVVSRRPARVRNTSRIPHAPDTLQQADNYRPLPTQHHREATIAASETSSYSPDRDQTVQSRTGKTRQPRVRIAPPPDCAQAKSVSPIDLDSFPLPPASCIPLDIGNGNTQQPKSGDGTKLETPSPSPSPVDNNAVITTPKAGPMSEARRSGVPSSRASKRASIDSTLIEAISRTIVQQMRLLSAAKHAGSSTASPRARSSTPNQQDALDSFIKGLQRCADKRASNGKPAASPPEPSRTPESLHTVSALLPFRPEFRAAGLAVTSKDQSQRMPSRISNAAAFSRAPRAPSRASPKRKQAHPSQMDGHRDAAPISSRDTEISFAAAKDMDEWRYALVEEAPVRKQKRPPKIKKPKRRCLSCFPSADDHPTDADWAHFRPVAENMARPHRRATVPKSRIGVPVKPLPKRPPPPRPPAETASSRTDSSILSPKRQSRAVVHGPRNKGKMATAEAVPSLKPRAASAPNRYLDMMPRAAAAAKARRSRLLPASHRKNSSQTNISPSRRPMRSRDDKIRGADEGGDAKTFAQEAPPARPGQSLPEGNTRGSTAPETASGRAYRSDGGCVTSEAPRTWRRQDGPFFTSPSSPSSPTPAEETQSAGLTASPKAGLRPASPEPMPQPSRPPPPPPLPPMSRSRTRHRLPHRDFAHAGICCRSSRTMTAGAAAPNIPRRTSSIRERVSSGSGDDELSGGSSSPDAGDGDDDDGGGIADRDVLRGLHMATSAACDNEVDAFVRARTGLRIRRFLADLVVLETVGGARDRALVEGHRTRARRSRQSDLRKLKVQVRRSRELRAAGFF